MKLADALVEALIRWEIKYVFGVSGANIEHLHDAINRLGKGRIESVMAKCENGAAFMADARARIHKTMGVCCSTSGGGMVNLLVGVAESYAESVPLLAIVGQPPSNLEGKGAFQDSSGIGRSVDAIKLWESVTKYTAKISHPEDFWKILLNAVHISLNGRPGPSALLIPRDLYDQDVGDFPQNFPSSLPELLEVDSEVDRSSLLKLIHEIKKAKAPVLILGHGIRRSRNSEAVISFAKSIEIPVVTTLSGKGEFPNNHPLYMGMVGVAGHPSVHRYLKEVADLIIVIGAGLNIMTRAPLAQVLNEKKIAVINIDAGEITRSVKTDIVIEADAGVVAQKLLIEFEKEPFKCLTVTQYQLERFQSVLAPEIPPDARPKVTKPLLQSEAIDILSQTLPTNGHLIFDAGNCAAAALHLTKIPPQCSSTIALGMGGMGYAIAAAVGAQLGSKPGTRTVVFCGDGAFLMLGFEVHTAVDLRLPVLFVVFNNNMHGMCVTRQQLFFESRLECVRYNTIEIAVLARGFGNEKDLWVGTAATVEELHKQLSAYQKHANDIPGVLELKLLREEVPPFTPFLPNDAPIELFKN
ncbi:MAG: thiamine pyrophosphate-binding protein [Blastocatellia bacterium]|nr:thiamine pyrophosphate-binding protein [Blastocatellia bacterium]